MFSAVFYAQNINWMNEKKDPFSLKSKSNFFRQDSTGGETIRYRAVKNESEKSYLPKGDYVKYKVKTEKQKDELALYLVLKGYKFNNPINIKDDSVLIGKRLKTNERFVSEVLVDTNDVKFLTIYSMMPSMMQINRQPLTPGKRFSVLPFQQGVKTTTKGAFLLIYEDDEKRSVYKYLKKFVKDQVLLMPFNPQTEPFSKIERYFIVDPLIVK